MQQSRKTLVANKIVLKPKELTSIALTYLTLRDFHEVSRAGGPTRQLSKRPGPPNYAEIRVRRSFNGTESGTEFLAVVSFFLSHTAPIINALLLSEHAYASRVPWREQKMKKKSNRSNKENDCSERTRFARKPVNETNTAPNRNYPPGDQPPGPQSQRPHQLPAARPLART